MPTTKSSEGGEPIAEGHRAAEDMRLTATRKSPRSKSKSEIDATTVCSKRQNKKQRENQNGNASQDTNLRHLSRTEPQASNPNDDGGSMHTTTLPLQASTSNTLNAGNKPVKFENVTTEQNVDAEDAACDVCGQETWTEKNLIVFCEGPGCNVAVHQTCYGIKSIPADEWFCEPCSAAQEAENGKVIEGINCYRPRHELVCTICNGKDGALIQVRHQGLRWAHLSCVLSIPETYLRGQHLYGLNSPSLQYRIKQQCSFCTRISGVCLTCSIRGCDVSYHVRCGQHAGATFTHIRSAANKPTMCATHSHILAEDELVEPNFRPTLTSSREKADLATSASGLTQPGNFEDCIARDPIRSVSTYTCSDLWRDVGARLDNITSAPSFQHLMLPNSKFSTLKDQAILTHLSRESDQSPIKHNSDTLIAPHNTFEIPSAHAEKRTTLSNEPWQTTQTHARLPETQKLYDILSRDPDLKSWPPHPSTRHEPRGRHISDCTIRVSTSDSEIVDAAPSSAVDQNQFPVGVMRFRIGPHPSQVNLEYSYIRNVNNQGEVHNPIAGTFDQDTANIVAMDTHVALADLRARVQAPENKTYLSEPHPESEQVDNMFKRLFGRCGDCETHDCVHKHELQQKELTAIYQRQIASNLLDRNKRIAELAGISHQDVNRARLEFLEHKTEKLAFLNAESLAIRHSDKNKLYTNTQHPQDLSNLASNEGYATSDEKEFMRMKLRARNNEIPKFVREGEDVSKATPKIDLNRQDQENKINEISEMKARSESKRKRQPPISSDDNQLIMTIRRTSEDSYELIKAHPMPKAHESPSPSIEDSAVHQS